MACIRFSQLCIAFILHRILQRPIYVNSLYSKLIRTVCPQLPQRVTRHGFCAPRLDHRELNRKRSPTSRIDCTQEGRSLRMRRNNISRRQATEVRFPNHQLKLKTAEQRRHAIRRYRFLSVSLIGIIATTHWKIFISVSIRLFTFPRKKAADTLTYVQTTVQVYFEISFQYFPAQFADTIQKQQTYRRKTYRGFW